MRRLQVRPVACVVVVVLAACASTRDSSRNDNTSNDPSTVEDAVAVLTAMCTWAMRCADTQGAAFVDLQACLAVLGPVTGGSCEPLRFVNSVGEVAACVASIDVAGCDTWIFGEDAPSAACEVLVPAGESSDPLTTVGGACDAARCPAGSTCTSPSGHGNPPECPVCVADAALDQPCGQAGLSYHCLGAAYCDGSTHTCTALEPADAACIWNEECLSGWCTASTCHTQLARSQACAGAEGCLGALVCLGGVCTDRGGDGTVCTPDGSECLAGFACVDGFCRADHYCGAGEVGDVCTSRDACVSTAFCDTANSRCAAKLATDASCFEWGSCEAPNTCSFVSRTCVAPVGVGGACSYVSDCQAGLVCDFAAHQCITAVANGSPCTSGAVCASGFCDHSGGTPAVCAAVPACVMP